MNQSNQTSLPLNFSSSTTTQRTNQIPNSSSLLILDQINSPSTFILLDFITTTIKSSIKRNLIFINTTSSIEQWHGLLQKQGIHLTNQIKSNSFKFISHSLTHPSDSLQDLFIKIQESSTTPTPSTLAPLIIIDDLSTLLWSGYPVQHILGFLNRLRRLQTELGVSLVIVLHIDLIEFLHKPNPTPTTQHSTEDVVLLNHLSAHSHVILKTRNLGLPGAGELGVFRGAALLDDLGLPVTVCMETVTQYRIHDNSVHYYTKGLDKGFL